MSSSRKRRSPLHDALWSSCLALTLTACSLRPDETATNEPEPAEYPEAPREPRDESWLLYPDDYIPAAQGTFTESCEAALARMPFKWRSSTHILVARHRVASSALSVDIDRLQGKLVSAIAADFVAALGGLDKDTPGTTPEVEALACTIESRDEARRIAEAAKAHIVVWGDVSHEPQRKFSGKIRGTVKGIVVREGAEASVTGVDPGAPYYLHTTITQYDDQLGVGSVDVGGEGHSIEQHTAAGERQDTLVRRIRLSVTMNLIRRGAMWLAERLLAEDDGSLMKLFEEVTHGHEEIRHMYMAQLYLSMARIKRARDELDAVQLTRQHDRTMFGGQYWALRGNLALLEGDTGQAIAYHKQALKVFRKAIGELLPLQTFAMLEAGAKATGKADFVTWALSPIEMLVAIDLLARNDVKIAEGKLKRAIETMQSGPMPHPLLPMALTQLSTLYRGRGDMLEAVKAAEQARRSLATVEKVSAPGSHLRDQLGLDTYVSLVQAYLASGQQAKAQALVGEAVVRAERIYGDVHPLTLVARAAQADVHEALGHAEAAIPQRKKVLADCDALRGDSAVACTSSAYNALGKSQVLAGDWEQAEASLVQAEQAHRKLHGIQSPGLWAIRNNRARIASEQGKPAEAAKLYAEALRMLEQTRSTQTDAYASVLTNLAIVELERDHVGKGVDMLRRALKIRQKMLPKTGDNASLALAYTNLATALGESGDLAGALRTGTEALRLGAASFGEDHPQYASIAGNLAGIYLDLGDSKRAEELYKSVERSIANDSGYESKEQAVRLVNNRGVLLKQKGQFEQALAAFQEARTLAKDLPKDNDLVQTIDANIAVELYHLKRYDESRKASTAALAGVKRKFTGKHGGVADLQWVLGEIALIEGHPREAIGYLAAGASYMRTTNQTHSVRSSTLFALARAYKEVGDTAREFAAREEMLQVALASRSADRADAIVWARFNLAERYKATQPERAHTEWEAMIRDGAAARSSAWTVIDAYANLAAIQHTHGAHAEEEALLRRGIDLGVARTRFGMAGRLYRTLGDCQESRGQLAQAVATWDSGIATSRRDDNPDTTLLSHLHDSVGDVLVLQGQYAAAIPRFQEAVKIIADPRKLYEFESKLMALLGLADALLGLDRESEARDAAVAAQQLLAEGRSRGLVFKPTSVVLIDKQLAVALHRVGEHEHALVAARRALVGAQAIQPTGWGIVANIHRTIADSLFALEDFAGAEAAFKSTLTSLERASPSPSRWASAHAAYGVLLQRQKRYDEAIIQYELALQRSPNHSLATLGLASISLRRGDFKRSSELVIGLLGSPDLPPTVRCQALELEVSIADQQHRWDASIAAAGRLAVGSCPAGVVARARWLAMNALSATRRHKEVLAQYGQLGDRVVTLPVRIQRLAHLAAARAYQSTGKRAEADRVFATALALGGDEARDGRAMLQVKYAAHLAALARVDDARLHLTKAREEIDGLKGTEGYPHHLAFAAGVYATLGDSDAARDADALVRRAIPGDAKQARQVLDLLTVARAVPSGWNILGPNAAVLVMQCVAPRCQKLVSGDVIVAYDGSKLAGNEDIQRRTRQTEGRDQVTLDIVRDGKPLTLVVRGGLLGVALR